VSSLRARGFKGQTTMRTNPLPLRGLDHHLLPGQGGAGLATMPPSSALLATTTAGSTFGQPRLRGTSPFPFATKQTLLQFGDLGFEDLDLVLQLLLLSQSSRKQALVRMSLLAQLDVFQPKCFLSLSHWKARLPGDEADVPNKMGSPENSLWSRYLRRNPVLVIHRILTSRARPSRRSPRRCKGVSLVSALGQCLDVPFRFRP